MHKKFYKGEKYSKKLKITITFDRALYIWRKHQKQTTFISWIKCYFIHHIHIPIKNSFNSIWPPFPCTATYIVCKLFSTAVRNTSHGIALNASLCCLFSYSHLLFDRLLISHNTKAKCSMELNPETEVDRHIKNNDW